MKDYLGPMRPPFLLLALACVFLGVSAAIWTGGSFSTLHIVLVFVAGLAAHISVNAFNEYFDFKTHLDERTRRTPFSGGSGTLQQKPELSGYVLGLAVVTSLITAAIGVYFVRLWGWSGIILGALGLFVVVAYTPWLTRNPILCLVAPGIGFGSVMVIAAHFALTGRYGWSVFTASLVPFFLVNDLLLLNQFPDVEADRSIGKRPFPVLIGRRSSSLIYISFLLLAYLSILLGVSLGFLPPYTLLGLLTVPIATFAGVGSYRAADDLQKLVPSMGMNVLVNILTPVLVAVGFLIG
jgi:1,4-dihydroxy-2-naphthoate octaprenyltransferase